MFLHLPDDQLYLDLFAGAVLPTATTADSLSERRKSVTERVCGDESSLHCVVLDPVSSVVTGTQLHHTVHHSGHRGVAHRLQGELHSVVQLTFALLSC